MNCREILARVAPLLLFSVAVASAHGQPSSAANIALREFGKGRIGALRMGIASSELEQRLGRRLALEFAGDGRAGVSFDQPAEIERLGVVTFLGARIEAVDIFFKKRGNALVADFLSLGVACAEVPKLRSRLSQLQDRNRTETPGLSGSNESNGMYAWGVEAKPSCRVWLREA